MLKYISRRILHVPDPTSRRMASTIASAPAASPARTNPSTRAFVNIWSTVRD